jgi:hypothetical protein
VFLNAAIPPEHVKAIPEHADFPGSAGEVTLRDIVVTVELTPCAWATTGLWVPAGVVATVDAPDAGREDVSIQIGSHDENLLAKPGPWKRWPTTVSVVPLLAGRMQIANPFGGIVYIVAGAIEERRKLTLAFHSVYVHPTLDVADPRPWEETKDSTAPWAEIVTKNVIFTVPRAFLPSIKDTEAIGTVYDGLTEGLAAFLSFTIVRPFRIVFDVDLPDENPTCGYPLVFPIDACADLLTELSAPSFPLFNATMMMGVISLREGYFDPTAETVFGTIAASVVLGGLFPAFDARNFAEISLPSMFCELWDIHTRFDPKLIPRTLALMQDPAITPPGSGDQARADFVRELCKLGGRDFTKLLERSRPIYLECSDSKDRLPLYEFVVCD